MFYVLLTLCFLLQPTAPTSAPSAAVAAAADAAATTATLGAPAAPRPMAPYVDADAPVSSPNVSNLFSLHCITMLINMLCCVVQASLVLTGGVFCPWIGLQN